jgi:electron transport complex protein RnfB
VVDPGLCDGCGTCVRTCPKDIIELMPLKARVWVPCSTKAPGKAVKAVCGVGCISCKMCIKVCPAKAVAMKDGVIAIDQRLCMDYGPDCGEVCVEKCPRHIFRYFSQKEENSRQQEAAPAA